MRHISLVQSLPGLRKSLCVCAGLIIATSGQISGALALESNFEAICIVTAGATGGHKHVTLKCHKVGRPGNYQVRSTYWQSKDKDAYTGLIRMAGREMRCDLSKSGSSSNREAINNYYSIENCRR
ncbi:MAG: hypothetical protein ABJO54_10990 [Hyphomicrobiales bacterium]